MTNKNMNPSEQNPDTELDVRETFDIDVDLKVPAFSNGNDYVPALDSAYKFDKNTTLAILAGFSHNRRAVSYTHLTLPTNREV